VHDLGQTPVQLEVLNNDEVVLIARRNGMSRFIVNTSPATFFIAGEY
jgi:hypothetical protein